MKKIFFIMFLSSFSFLASAQDGYRKMLDADRQWTYDQGSLIVSLDGPVEVSGKSCYQIKARIANESVSRPTGMYICEESRCVYVYNYYDYISYPNQWVKRFDFNLKIGEEGVKSIDNVLVSGETYRILNFGEYSWIEGIGDSRFGILPISFFYQTGITVGDNQFSVSDKGQDVFSTNQFSGVVANMNHVTVDSNLQPNSLFDLQGHRLQGEPQRKGVYIRGGRKYVRP